MYMFMLTTATLTPIRIPTTTPMRTITTTPTTMTMRIIITTITDPVGTPIPTYPKNYRGQDSPRLEPAEVWSRANRPSFYYWERLRWAESVLA